METNHKAKDFLSREKGAATIIAMLTVFTTLIIALTYLSLAQAELRMVTRNIQSRQALYLAEAGLDLSRAELAQDPFWRPQPKYNLNTGNFSISITQAGTSFIVVSEGKSGDATRKIEGTLVPLGTGWKLSAYKEIYN